MVHVEVATGTYGVGRICFHIHLYFLYELIFFVEDFVIGISVIHQRALVAIDHKASASALYREVVTATSFPCNHFLFAKFKACHLSIGCLPIVLKCIPATSGIYLRRIINSKEPSAGI